MGRRGREGRERGRGRPLLFLAFSSSNRSVSFITTLTLLSVFSSSYKTHAAVQQTLPTYSESPLNSGRE